MLVGFPFLVQDLHLGNKRQVDQLVILHICIYNMAELSARFFLCVCVCCLFMRWGLAIYSSLALNLLILLPHPTRCCWDYKYIPPLGYIATVLNSDLWVHLDLQLVLLIKSISPVFPSIHYSKLAIHS